MRDRSKVKKTVPAQGTLAVIAKNPKRDATFDRVMRSYK